MGVQLFTGALGAGFVPSSTLLIVGEQLTLDFLINASGGPTTVNFFLEFSEDGVTWFREVAEEDAGKGVVSMPQVVRTLADNNSTAIANNTAFKASCQFVRQAPLARVQVNVTAGVASLVLTSPFGTIPTSP